MKVALVYDRVNKWGGAERVLLALHKIFPDAPLFTSVYSKESTAWAEVFPAIIPTFLQKIPFAKTNHAKLAFLMPIAFETLSLDSYDLVISVTSEAAKGIITGPSTLHICYCLTPTRYLWSGYDEYFANPFIKSVTIPVTRYLRTWDKISAKRPDVMIAISTEVQKRIQRYYERTSEIIYPPVSMVGKNLINKPRKGYLVVSRLVKYKKIELAVKAFNELALPLTVVGVGKEEKLLKRLAQENIIFLGEVTDKQLAELYSTSRALVMPQFEDFGLVSVEAQAHGTPVIAYAKGGSIDTIINGKTGLLFEQQTVDSLKNGINQFEKMHFNLDTIKENAGKFSEDRFKKEFKYLIEKYL